jgi:hypothetical protein
MIERVTEKKRAGVKSFFRENYDDLLFGHIFTLRGESLAKALHDGPKFLHCPLLYVAPERVFQRGCRGALANAGGLVESAEPALMLSGIRALPLENASPDEIACVELLSRCSPLREDDLIESISDFARHRVNNGRQLQQGLFGPVSSIFLVVEHCQHRASYYRTQNLPMNEFVAGNVGQQPDVAHIGVGLEAEKLPKLPKRLGEARIRFGGASNCGGQGVTLGVVRLALHRFPLDAREYTIIAGQVSTDKIVSDHEMSSKTYSTSQVAALLGVARQTLYNWIESGLLDAPELVTAGNASIRLWTEKHIKAARKLKGTLKPGPKKARKP